MCMIALRSVLCQRKRFIATVFGLALLFLLCLVQVGLLVGWCLTTSEIIWRADADLWVMASRTPALDYAAPIPSRRIYQTRSVPGVLWAEGMIVKWALWQRPDGRLISVEVVGVDRGLVGAPWNMQHGQAAHLWIPDSVIVDAAYLDALGLVTAGDEVDISGSRAVVRGISQGVRTFTASPFVFTSLPTSRQYVRSVGHEEISFVLARCEKGIAPQEAAQRIARAVPNVEVLTRRDFAWRTAAYWMLRTGAGATVLVVAGLGFGVSVLVVSQSLCSLTMDLLPHYSVLRALGFSGYKLAGIVLCQSGILAAVGVSLGGLFFLGARQMTIGTTLSMAMPRAVLLVLVAAYLLSCLGASVIPIRTVLRHDPASAFRV